MKRHRSPDAVGEGRSRAKLSKASSESAATVAEAEQLSGDHRGPYITVSLRSATKAARNDTKPLRTHEEWQQVFQTYLHTGDPDGDISSPQATEAKDEPRGPDPAGHASAAADLAQADGQRSAGHCSPVGPAPTENSGKPSQEGDLDGSDEDGDSGRTDGQPHTSDEDEDEDEYGNKDSYGLSNDDLDLDYGLPWFEEIDGDATLKPSTDMTTIPRLSYCGIGHCNAKLIRRDMMRESFWLEMEETTQETHALASDLFDRYGRLQPELYDHEIIKGSGVWGKELDHGDLLLFDEVKVDAAYRGRGIGTNLVNAILEKTKKTVSERMGFFALASPGFLRGDIPRDDPTATTEAKQDAMKTALRFWHSMGFRRVGTSAWLAWTDSPGHPSRQLGIAQDWIRPDDPVADVLLSGELEQTCQKLADPTIKATECIDDLTKIFPEDFEDAQWQRIDQDGNTLLHIASMSSKPELVSFLLSKVPRLTAVRNREGYTALEALQNQLERQRTWRSDGHRSWVTSDAFKGFGPSSIACVAILENTAVFDLSTLSPLDIVVVSSATDEQIRRAPHVDIAGIRKMLQYKYGCTCGQCIGGFLSPRMKLALLCVSEVVHDMLRHPTFTDLTGPDWVDDNDHLLTHLPESVRENLKTNKSMREGFTNMFGHFSKCLQQGRIPTEEEILDYYRSHESEWPPVTRNYLQRGGSVAAAANMIFERAMKQDEWAGGGYQREVFGRDIDELVVCRNDHEFGFVAGMCGYKRVRPASSRFFADSSGREHDPDSPSWFGM